MKQFIDKLIERLEEESRDMQENMVKSTSNSMANFCSGACGAYNKTIAIVNQLAEEHKEQHSDQDLMIVASLPSLYPLQAFEEEAIHRVVERAKSSNIQTIDVSELLGEQGNDGWISVEDKLPEDTHSVLIITKANTIWTAFYDKEYDEWRDDVDERILSVIAWHEIPAFCRAKG